MCCISKLFLALTPFLGFIASADEAVGTNSYQLRGAGRSLEDATSISDDDDLEDASEEDELEALENEAYWAMTANLTACEEAFFEFTDTAECRTEKGVDAEHECSGTCHELACSMEAACTAGSEIMLIQRGDTSRELDVEKIDATAVQELVQELRSAQATCPCSSRRLRRGIRRRAFRRRGFRGGFRRWGSPACSKFGWCRFR